MAAPSRLRPLLACVALTTVGLLPTAAWPQVTYTVDVRLDLQDVEVEVEPVPQSGILVMRLTNKGSVRARCDLRYDPSPQRIQRSHAFIEPGATAQNVLRAQRKWFRVTVDVACRPA